MALHRAAFDYQMKWNELPATDPLFAEAIDAIHKTAWASSPPSQQISAHGSKLEGYYEGVFISIGAILRVG
eukprot:1159107-Pelagomonas_calceolata.AAC.4